MTTNEDQTPRVVKKCESESASTHARRPVLSIPVVVEKKGKKRPEVDPDNVCISSTSDKLLWSRNAMMLFSNSRSTIAGGECTLRTPADGARVSVHIGFTQTGTQPWGLQH